MGAASPFTTAGPVFRRRICRIRRCPASCAWTKPGNCRSARGEPCWAISSFHFVGRKSACINVGGAKVYLLEVEAVIRGAPDQGADGAAARRHIFPACRQELARDKAPAIIEFKECLAMTKAGKVFRS